MLLVIDNYDSFVHNLARYFRRLGQVTTVVRNDSVSADEVLAMNPQAIVLSPGPGTPGTAGNSLSIVRALAPTVPILGVCLGHQTIAQAWGGQVVRADCPIHGRSSTLHHSGDGLFEGLPSPMQVGRYHSLIVSTNGLPDDLVVNARLEDGTIMAFHHKAYPLFGVQFHPESVLTEYGYELLARFLRLIGLSVRNLPSDSSELIRPRQESSAAHPAVDGPGHPITF